MFVPVACPQCGKPFQVAGEVVGKSAVCPWCRAAVLALPVAAPAPDAGGGPTPPARPEPAEVLSLDDAPAAAPAPAVPVRRVWWSVAIVAGVVVLVLAALATVAYLRYKQGHIVMEWTAFTAPDGSCSVELLGRAAEDAATQSGEKRYASEGWYSGTAAWVGWRELSQREVQLAGTKDAFHQLAKVFDAERDRLKEKYAGTLTKEATIKFEDPLTREVRLATPEGGAVVERMIVMHKGSRPRVYFVGMAGRIDPDGDEVKRLFDSFKVFE